jgi:hypothetical protein
MTPFTTRKRQAILDGGLHNIHVLLSYAATRGLFYSHMGWIFLKPTYERMELIDREDLDSDPGESRRISPCPSEGLSVPPVVRFQHKNYGDSNGAYFHSDIDVAL